MTEVKTTPRGIRNNNPLNIRIGNEWKGEVENPTDKEFEQFVSLFWGLRAGFMLLRRYMLRYGLETIIEIVSRWAPPSENNSLRYARFVASELHCSVMEKLSWFNREKMLSLVEAMIKVECGQTVPRDEIERAYDAVCRQYI